MEELKQMSNEQIIQQLESIYDLAKIPSSEKSNELYQIKLECINELKSRKDVFDKRQKRRDYLYNIQSYYIDERFLSLIY